MNPPDPIDNEHLQRLIAKRQKGREIGLMYREYLYHSVSGLEVGVGIAMGAVLGYFGDRYFGTDPWLMLAGLCLGVVHAGRVMYRLAKRNTSPSATEPHVAPDPETAESESQTKKEANL